MVQCWGVGRNLGQTSSAHRESKLVELSEDIAAA